MQHETPDHRISPQAGASSVPADPSEDLEIEQRLAFLELAHGDRERLREVAGALNASSTGFIDTFYRHLFSFEATARFLGDPELLARLKRMQQAHLESMLAARWDEEYVQQRRRVGDAHAHLGIDPQMFLGAYNQYLQYALRELISDDSTQRAQVEQLSSLLKVVLLDIGLTLDAYFAQATQNLRQALEMLFQANAELKHFAQLTSHDLKTPLGTVANLCEEALDEFGTEMPGEARRLIEAARNRTYRMSTLIDELLASTMTPQGSRQQEVVSTPELIDEILEQLRPQLSQKNIEVVIGPELPRVAGEPVRLREAFFNLISNAIKFMDKPRGRIAIDVEMHDGNCTFSIADNGPGIPKDEFTRIFAPFSRLAAHRNVPGSGLGLYFAKSMIEEQGGRIWVESEPGEGTRFFVLLKQA